MSDVTETDGYLFHRINLDQSATTPIHPEVIEVMMRCCRDQLANPASAHQPGQRARRILEEARDGIAEALGADLNASTADRLVFTSGGTEANCLALLGIAHARSGGAATKAESRGTDSPNGPGAIILSALEHPSVQEPAEHLARCGWRVEQLEAYSDGEVCLENLPDLLATGADLVSVILGNHETGVLQAVPEVARLCRNAGVPCHTDAIQVAGKLPIDFRGLGVSALSVAAHKFHGPPGIGALLLTADVPVQPLFYGGHQQQRLRPGTEPVVLAVGMHKALEVWQRDHNRQPRRLAALRDRFEQRLRQGFPALIVNGAQALRLPHISNLAFPGLDGQILLLALDTAGVACSLGSACSSGSSEPSPTLTAMGLPDEVVRSSLRFSFSSATTEDDIDEAIIRILGVVDRMAA